MRPCTWHRIAIGRIRLGISTSRRSTANVSHGFLTICRRTNKSVQVTMQRLFGVTLLVAVLMASMTVIEGILLPKLNEFSILLIRSQRWMPAPLKTRSAQLPQQLLPFPARSLPKAQKGTEEVKLPSRPVSSAMSHKLDCRRHQT